MALKDWKKEKENKDYISFKKKDEHKYLVISKDVFPNIWNVEVGSDFDGFKKLKPYFNSKSEAIKFAKEYMKNN